MVLALTMYKYKYCGVHIYLYIMKIALTCMQNSHIVPINMDNNLLVVYITVMHVKITLPCVKTHSSQYPLVVVVC